MPFQIRVGWHAVKVSPDGADGYDIIGDIHGCADALQLLLLDLGYRQKNGAFRHPFRKVVFLGDLIDRGPHIRDVLHIVRAMVESESAYLTLGNHEYNAICYETRAPEDAKYKYLRPHFPRHKRHLVATLEQFENHREEWQDMVAWLKMRPICLEFEHFRAVHACWDQAEINKLRIRNPACNLVDTNFLLASTNKENPEYRMVERLLKGTEIKLPDGKTIDCRDGVRRNRFRTKFWHNNPETYGDVIFQPDNLPEDMFNQLLGDEEKNNLVFYTEKEKPLFVGHYWRVGEPCLISKNIACLDYSAVNSGLLVCYRMDNEPSLLQEKLYWIISESAEEEESDY